MKGGLIMLRTDKGFTLMELMIVVAIIGILAAVAVPNFMRSREKSRFSACVESMRTLHEAAASFEQDHRTWEGLDNDANYFCRYITHSAGCENSVIQNRMQGGCPNFEWPTAVTRAEEEGYTIETTISLKEMDDIRIYATADGVLADSGTPKGNAVGGCTCCRPEYVCIIDGPDARPDCQLECPVD